MRQLSPGEIEVARRKVLRNAVGLLRDARLLFRRRRYARAYALAHLASEEMSKIPMLVRAGLESQVNPRFDWKTLGKRLQSHKSKLKQAAVFDYILEPEMAHDADVKRLKKALEEIDDANDLKNRSLYPGVVGNAFLSPLESVSAAAAKTMIALSESRLSTYLSIERQTTGAVLRATPAHLSKVQSFVSRILGGPKGAGGGG
jgi:AbiV family abortive infection protein